MLCPCCARANHPGPGRQLRRPAARPRGGRLQEGGDPSPGPLPRQCYGVPGCAATWQLDWIGLQPGSWIALHALHWTGPRMHLPLCPPPSPSPPPARRAGFGAALVLIGAHSFLQSDLHLDLMPTILHGCTSTLTHTPVTYTPAPTPTSTPTSASHGRAGLTEMDGTLAIVCEHCDGGDLDGLLIRPPPAASPTRHMLAARYGITATNPMEPVYGLVTLTPLVQCGAVRCGAVRCGGDTMMRCDRCAVGGTGVVRWLRCGAVSRGGILPLHAWYSPACLVLPRHL